jgi:predicted regulator of Ras-like GTPase activity (Roadblock/LC7/MglB family)
MEGLPKLLNRLDSSFFVSLVGGFGVTDVAETLMADIEQVLIDFDERAGGLVAVVLLMKTGLPVAARIRVPVEETFLSASLASLLGIALDLSDKLFTVTPARVILDTEAGSLILYGVNDDMSLVAIFKKQHLGAMILLVEQAAKELARLFQSP